MKTLLISLLALFTAQVDIPKNDPTGLWESSSGTQYQLKLTGDSDLSVRLVPGSNSRYSSYEVDLKVSKDEKNTYVGKGFFVAKVKADKECKFETEWQLTVFQKDHILGGTTNVVPDPDTCKVKETSQAQLNLTRKK